MMRTTPILSTPNSSGGTTPTSGAGLPNPQSLDNMFVQLLVAQLQNQDPLTPDGSIAVCRAAGSVQRVKRGHIDLSIVAAGGQWNGIRLRRLEGRNRADERRFYSRRDHFRRPCCALRLSPDDGRADSL